MLEFLVKFPSFFKKKLAEADRKAVPNMAEIQKPAQQAQEWNGPNAVALPVMPSAKAEYAAISASGKVLTDSAGRLIEKYKSLNELYLTSQKSGKEYMLDPKTAWDFIESASRLLDKLGNQWYDVDDWHALLVKKTDDFCIEANRIIRQNEKELFDERLAHNEEISRLKKGFLLVEEGYKNRIAEFERHPGKAMQTLQLQYDGKIFAMKEEHKQALAAKDAEFAKFRSDYVAEVQKLEEMKASQIAAAEQKCAEKISALETQLSDMDGLEKAAREELNECKLERAALHAEIKRLSESARVVERGDSAERKASAPDEPRAAHIAPEKKKRGRPKKNKRGE